MPNERITLGMSGAEICKAMAEGNIGGATVCISLLKHNAEIDHDSLLGNLGSILILDTLNIYGSRIWMLYKDVCKENIATTIALLRAYQLGVEGIAPDSLNFAIDNMGAGIIIDDVVKAVKEELPDFRADLDIRAGE